MASSLEDARYGDRPMTWRAVLALLLAGVAAALGALILGEYEFQGTLPFVAGPLFGLLLGEVVVGVGRSRAVLVGLLAAAEAAGGIVWAGWIDSSEGIEPMKGLVWVAAALAAGAALLRTIGLWSRGRAAG